GAAEGDRKRVGGGLRYGVFAHRRGGVTATGRERQQHNPDERNDPPPHRRPSRPLCKKPAILYRLCVCSARKLYFAWGCFSQKGMPPASINRTAAGRAPSRR